MTKVLDGIRVLEVASWTFVPAAGAVLADWGADVIKVEHPETGDPQRALMTMGIIPGGENAVNYMIEQPNRGKRSIGIDISTDGGRELIYRLAASSDVFLTSFLTPVRKKLGIDIDDIRTVNPSIVYARGTGQGPKGPDADRGGLDGASYWARGGIADALTPKSLGHPIGPRPAFGDLPGGMTIAGGIAAGLLHRERTGEGVVVDISLLGCAMWTLSPDIVASELYGGDPIPKFDRAVSPNPLVGYYRTKDDRFLSIMMLQADRFWPDVCERIGKPELITDPRFADMGARFQNSAECVRILDETFASRTLAEWREAFADAPGVWAAVQQANELPSDPQVEANGYMPVVDRGDTTYQLVANPVQFDQEPPMLTPAPEHGQHTEELLLELGLTWDEILAHKETGAIL